MRTLIVYESMFGNTKLLAEAVADGLARHGPVDLVEVSAAPQAVPGGVDLLIVGGPTHAFGLSRPKTRDGAAQQASDGLVSRGIGIREWLDRLHRPDRDVPTVAFDTKIAKPAWLPGSAARGAAKRLRRLGLPQAMKPESFYVTGTPGPLKEGELDRARQWAEALAQATQTAAAR